MTNDVLLKLIEENEITHPNREQWQEMIEQMDEQEKTELGEILSQQEKESNILATRQSNELVDLMHKCKLDN